MRINRNTRRSARPVFRSVNSSRRRAKMYGNYLNSARRRNMNCSANNNVVYYADLNTAQKDYVLANWEKWSEMEWLWNLFYEDEAESEDATPETWWVDDMLEDLSYDDIATFEIVDDKTAVPEKKAPDDFNTYINYLNSSRRRNGRRALNSARSLEIYSFNELNEAQKDYVVKHALESSLADGIWQWFNETLMEQYHYDVEELAKQYEERLDSEYNLIDFKIHTDKIYWEESSQGPYPKWNFEKVFDSFTVTEDGSIDVEFNGGGLDVDKAAYFDVYRQDEAGEWQYDEYGDAPDASYKASEIIGVLQEFINKVWSLVNDVCQAYPDEDYIYDDLANNDYAEFIATSETEAKPVSL